MGSQAHERGIAHLLQKFMALSWAERWQNIWPALRWMLRSHVFDSSHMVLLGRGVHIHKRNGRITTGGTCEINDGCDITVDSLQGPLALLHIGHGANIGFRTLIYVREHVEIGADSMISWNCTISDSDLHQLILPDGRRPPRTLPVTIEHDVWLGHHCIVLKGVTIGHHSVVAAGSVVCHSAPPYSLLAGNPARRIGEVGGWER